MDDKESNKFIVFFMILGVFVYFANANNKRNKKSKRNSRNNNHSQSLSIQSVSTGFIEEITFKSHNSNKASTNNSKYNKSNKIKKSNNKNDETRNRHQLPAIQSSNNNSSKPERSKDFFNFDRYIEMCLKIIGRWLWNVLKRLVTWIIAILVKLYRILSKSSKIKAPKGLVTWIVLKLLKSSQTQSPTDETGWTKLGNYGFPLLNPYDMSASINEVTANKKLNPPRNTTKFLKEIGYLSSSSKGTDKTNHSQIILSLTDILSSNIPAITKWKATPTTAASITEMIKVKIDRQPVEQHQHWSRLRTAYDVLAKWMLHRNCKLERLSNEEVIKSLKLTSSMGLQEESINGLKFNTVKDYIEYKDSKGQHLWQERVKMFRQSLEDEKPMLGIFNAKAKAEKKNKNLDRANRLIWYLPATARIFETQVFGGVEDLLKKLPYSVSGTSLYDYGELLADIMEQNNRKAICNDISGWDTRVSYGLLCLEANFLQNLTPNISLKKDIKNLYRLYANAHVMIARKTGSNDETVIYKLRGQVTSGRRTTYVMNTITNTVVSMCAAAYSYGISDYNFENWMMNCLNKGHTDDFGGKISGDDSVLIFGAKQARLYAQHAHKFLNAIGLIRKNLKLYQESHVIDSMLDINFCSNNFVKVKYGKNSIERWMPVKPIELMLGKARIMLEKPKDKDTEEAWARIQGLELLVYYHHIPEVKALALALLSCTRKDWRLESISTGWRRLTNECLQESDPLEIIDKCLFGKSTKVQKFRNLQEKVIKSWSDLGELDMQSRLRIGTISEEFRQEWYKSIPQMIQRIRKTNQNHLYDDWNNCMKEIKNKDGGYEFAAKLWKFVVDLF